MNGKNTPASIYVTYAITASGKVQGVFYRQFCLRQAKELEINGTVQNLPDSSVQLIVSGPVTKLDELVKRCKIGPPRSKVESINIVKMEFIPFKEFSVLPSQ